MSAKSPTAAASHPADVVVRVHVAAARETVWSFLSDGERFARWIGAFAGQAPLPGTRIDARVGGALRVEYPGGNAATGQIVEMVAPERVTFTWGYESAAQGVPPGSTRVTVSLHAAPDGTLVELRHAGLPDEPTRQGHLGGWTHYLAMLSRDAADQQHGQRAAEALTAYLRAWNETDAAARLALLAGACEPDVRVRSSFACTEGVEDLAAHIANGQRHMPGLRLHAVGPVTHVHGHACVRWAVRGPDGRDAFTGLNVGLLSPGGRLARVISFPDPPPGPG